MKVEIKKKCKYFFQNTVKIIVYTINWTPIVSSINLVEIKRRVFQKYHDIQNYAKKFPLTMAP